MYSGVTPLPVVFVGYDCDIHRLFSLSMCVKTFLSQGDWMSRMVRSGSTLFLPLTLRWLNYCSALYKHSFTVRLVVGYSHLHMYI